MGDTERHGLPREAYLRLFLVRGSQWSKRECWLIKGPSDLSGEVRIRSEAQALEFVRLFTTIETWYLFKFSCLEVIRAHGECTYCEIAGPEYDARGLSAPHVSQERGRWVVERDLVDAEKEVRRCREFIGPRGEYAFEFVRTVGSFPEILIPAYW